MPENINYSSKQMLNELSKRKAMGEFDVDAFYKVEKEIENKMEEFDLEKRIKAAQAAEELSKLVITA
jgi:hypothetical protein